MFLDLPECLRKSDSFAPLLQTATHELVQHFLHFEQMWQTDDFLQLSCEALIVLLQSDELNVTTENTVYQVCEFRNIEIFPPNFTSQTQQIDKVFLGCYEMDK
jgi:hypothetical protein